MGSEISPNISKNLRGPIHEVRLGLPILSVRLVCAKAVATDSELAFAARRGVNAPGYCAPWLQSEATSRYRQWLGCPSRTMGYRPYSVSSSTPSATSRTVVCWPPPHAMSLAAASKHIKLLEHAGLIRREVRGRTHVYRLAPGPLALRRTGITGRACARNTTSACPPERWLVESARPVSASVPRSGSSRWCDR